MDGKPAARNTRVRVAFFAPGKLPTVRVVRHGGKGVPARARTLVLSGLRIVELTPRRALKPGATYDVVVDKRTIGSFTATRDVDARPPTWAGVAKATYVVEHVTATERTPDGSRIRIIRSESMCYRPDPYAVLTIEPVEDDIAAPDEVLFAVWIPDAKGVLDTTRPPFAYVAAQDGHISLGSTSVCDPIRFAFPKARQYTIAIAAVDSAGNQTAPVEVTLDLAHAATHSPAP